MRPIRMPKRAGVAALGLGLVAGITLVSAPAASSHGYTDTPISRQKLCANRTVSDCGAIQWEPQSVEGFKGSRPPVPPTARYVPAGSPSSPSSTTRAVAPGPPPR